MPQLSTLPRPKQRLITYIRVSTAREDMISPELQEHTCRKYAEAAGATIIDVLSDLDLSGKDFARRKIGSIIARVAAGEADGVLVYRYDRFGRNIELSLTNLRALESIGGVAQSATEHFDTSTAAGRFARTNMLGVAEFQRELIGENWMSTHASRLRKGLPHHGAPRFGYWYCDTCPMPEPRSPRGVRRERQQRQKCEKCKAGIQIPRPVYGEALGYSFEEFASGSPLSRITHEIRLEGIRSYSGKIITDQHLLAILDTGFGAGYIRVTPDAQSWADELPESAVAPIGIRKIDRFSWIPGAHEAVTSESNWEAFLERRKARPRRASHKTRAKYQASGLVFCIDCEESYGVPMTAGSSRGAGGGKYLTWRCSNIRTGLCNHSTASREAVDEAIKRFLVEYATDDSAARRVAEETLDQARAQQPPDDSAHWQAEVERLERMNSNLIRMRMAEQITENEFLTQRDETANEIAEAKGRLAQARAHENPVLPGTEVFRGLLAEWEDLDADTRRAALKKVVWRILAKKGDFHDLNRYKIIPRWEMPSDA
ncbi:recombinase family protein [Streptomyces yunnanensis]|uniref:Resolvase, N terminal domain n=1 Tax=Streptomyces yunnanensis TaxID=156453 RepID=A0A9X8MSI2_9ACTN|nr:recombinase family protein [Streptomyces yunnanensis]SHL62475.1 Resolvase, N terminal domain [Streptomyces yunnanensis]